MNDVARFGCDRACLPRVGDALTLLRQRLPPCNAVENVTLAQAPGRVLADNVEAQLNVPSRNRSAMDGYAFRFDDRGPLRQLGQALAGRPFCGDVQSGECVAVATGGILPDGCDTVAMRECCNVTPEGVSVAAKLRGANVRRRGEDCQMGDRLLSAGTILRARQIGLLAAAGVQTVAVHRPLRIALLSVGDELVDAASGVRDANRPMLHTLCSTNGFAITDLGILPDNRALLADTLARAAAANDVILTTAGTSAGDEDYVRAAITDCGGQMLLAGVAIKPGKPLAFGTIGHATVISLPGNPAAAYITFLILGLPILRHLSRATMPPTRWVQVTADFPYRKRPGMREYLRVRLVQLRDGSSCAHRCGPDGSAMLASLAISDGLAVIDEETTETRAGDPVSFASFEALEHS